jgi:hypothetical protein
MGRWADRPLADCQATDRSIETPGKLARLLSCLIEFDPVFSLNESQVSCQAKGVREFGQRPEGDVQVATKLSWTLFR